MFRAVIKEGKLSFGPIILKQFTEWLEMNEGKAITLELEKLSRSGSQQRFYWVYLAAIERETGNLADDLHEFFKRKFLPPVFKTILGTEVKMPASTKGLDKMQFTDYMDKICALTNVPIPDAEKYKQWVDSAPLVDDKYIE